MIHRGALPPWRTIPVTCRAPARLGCAAPASPAPDRVQRRVSSRGIQIIGQRVQVGFRYAGTTVTIEVEDTVRRVLNQHDHVLTVVPRTSRKEVTRERPTGTPTTPRPRKCHPSDEAKSVQHQVGLGTAARSGQPVSGHGTRLTLASHRMLDKILALSGGSGSCRW